MFEQGCSLKFYAIAALEGQIEFRLKVFGKVDCSALCNTAIDNCGWLLTEFLVRHWVIIFIEIRQNEPDYD